MRVLFWLLLALSGAQTSTIYVPDSSVPLRIAAGSGGFFLWSRLAIFKLRENRFDKVASCLRGCRSAVVLGDGRVGVLDGDSVAIISPTGGRQELPDLPSGFEPRGIATYERLLLVYGSTEGRPINKTQAAALLRGEYAEVGGGFVELMPSVLIFQTGKWESVSLRTPTLLGQIYALAVGTSGGVALTPGHVLRAVDGVENWDAVPREQICRGFTAGDCEWKDAAVSPQGLWIAGTDGFLARSQDSGVTWISEAFGGGDLCQVVTSQTFVVLKTCNGQVWRYFNRRGARVPGVDSDARDLWAGADVLWVLSSDSSRVLAIELRN